MNVLNVFIKIPLYLRALNLIGANFEQNLHIRTKSQQIMEILTDFIHLYQELQFFSHYIKHFRRQIFIIFLLNRIWLKNSELGFILKNVQFVVDTRKNMQAKGCQ